MVLNAYHDLVRVHPAAKPRRPGLEAADRHQPARQARSSVFAFGDAYDVTGRSLLLFAMEAEAA